MYTNWFLEENENRLVNVVKVSRSFAGVMKKLNLIPAGGNYNNIKRHIARLDIDISHFTHQGWNKENYKNASYKGTRCLKSYIIRIRGLQCESCKKKKWLGENIPLELEHVDGNRFNNDESNLKLLCCNCHAFTKTWRRKKQ